MTPSMGSSPSGVGPVSSEELRGSPCLSVTQPAQNSRASSQAGGGCPAEQPQRLRLLPCKVTHVPFEGWGLAGEGRREVLLVSGTLTHLA